MSALIRHVEYFDLNKDGKIMPWETYIGFRRLGYNRLISIFSVFIINGAMSYPSQDSWIPDPLFSILIKNINNCKHGSDTGIYDHEGEMNETRINQVFSRFSKNGKIGFRDVWRLTNYYRVIYDFFGWSAAKIEWIFSYILLLDKGHMTKDDVTKIIDGSIFYEKDLTKKHSN
jgi:peroxygenase